MKLATSMKHWGTNCANCARLTYGPCNFYPSNKNFSPVSIVIIRIKVGVNKGGGEGNRDRIRVDRIDGRIFRNFIALIKRKDRFFHKIVQKINFSNGRLLNGFRRGGFFIFYEFHYCNRKRERIIRVNIDWIEMGKDVK